LSKDDKEMTQNRLIVVLGMHRSGTSAITRGLQVLGVQLGTRLIPPVESNNIKGFWEDREINSLNIEMQNFLVNDWHNLSPIQSGDVAALRKNGYTLRAVELLRRKLAEAPLFGFKDPRVAKLLPFWKEVFEHCQLDVGYVLALRHPLSVAKSLAQRDRLDPGKSYLLWLGHVLTSLMNTAGHKRVIVDYDRLMQAPEHELNRIGEGLSLTIEPVELQHYKTEFLDQGLRHSVHDLNDLVLDAACPPIVREVYASLLDLASNETTVNDVAPKGQIAAWAGEFERLKSLLSLVDRLSTQNANALQLVAERDTQIAGLAKEIADRDGQAMQLLQTIESLIVDRDAQKSGLTLLRQEHDQLVAQRDTQIAGLAKIIADRDEQVAQLLKTINSLIADRDAQKLGFEQLLQRHNQLIVQRDSQVASLNEVVANLESKNSVVTHELQTIILSRSWKLTKPLRLAGRILRGDWAAVRGSVRSRHGMKNNLPIDNQDSDGEQSLNRRDEQNSPLLTQSASIKSPAKPGKRILLVSYYCPSRAHAGGLRILDIYSLIKTSFPEVMIDLYTHKRTEIDWSYADVERLFDHVYFSPAEDLLPDQLSELSVDAGSYDVIDLQFHQSAYHLEKWRMLGGKIIFTPMESLVRSLLYDARAAFKNGNLSFLKKFIRSIKSAAEEIVFSVNADEVVCVSRSDASILRLLCRSKKINYLETAISSIEFSDAMEKGYGIINPEAKECSVLYVAYFGSETNVNALKWFIDYVHPLIKEIVPEYKLKVVGRGDLSTFDDYQDNSIDFIGEVPNLSPYIQSAKVGIAPALSGAGFRGKINQYSIFGVPSVVSPVSAKGLAYVDGVDIYIAEAPDVFADRCIRLLKDNELNKSMGRRAKELAISKYSWESKLDAIKKIYSLEGCERG